LKPKDAEILRASARFKQVIEKLPWCKYSGFPKFAELNKMVVSSYDVICSRCQSALQYLVVFSVFIYYMQLHLHSNRQLFAFLNFTSISAICFFRLLNVYIEVFNRPIPPLRSSFFPLAHQHAIAFIAFLERFKPTQVLRHLLRKQMVAHVNFPV